MADAKIVISAEDRATSTLKGVASEFDRFGSAASSAIAPLLRLQGAIAAVGASAVVVGLKAVVSALDDLDEAAQGVGLTARSLAELRQAAIFAGVDSEKLDKSLSGLANRLSDAAKGGAESVALFNALGIAIKNNDGTLRGADDVLGDLAERFSQFRDGAEKTALANQLFGDRLGRVLIPYLNQGRDGLKQYAGVTAEAVAESAKLQQEFDKLAANSARFRNELAGAVIPKVNETIDLIRKIDWGKISGANAEWGSTYKVLAEVGRQLNDIAKKGAQAQQALIGAGGVLDANDARARGRITAPTVSVPGAPTKDSGLTDAQRALSQYVETLTRALQTAQDLSESEKAAAAIRSGAFGEVTPQVRQLVMALAEQIDTTKALRKIEEDSAKARAKEQEEELRRIKTLTDFQDKLRASISDQYQKQAELFKSDEQKIGDERAKQLQLAIDAREADLISEADYQDRRFKIMEFYAQQFADLEARRYGAAKAYRELDLQAAGAFFNQMSGLMNSNSRKLFEIGKAGAIGETIVNTYSAAMGAYKALASIPVVGPALGAAAAAAAIATGIANVQRIKSTAFGGGGGSVAGSNVATPGQGPFNTNVATPASAAPRGPAIQITLSGSGRYSAQEVRDLITQINEQAGLGATVAVAA